MSGLMKHAAPELTSAPSESHGNVPMQSSLAKCRDCRYTRWLYGHKMLGAFCSAVLHKAKTQDRSCMQALVSLIVGWSHVALFGLPVWPDFEYEAFQ